MSVLLLIPVRGGSKGILKNHKLLKNWSGRDFCLGEKRKDATVSENEAQNIDRPVDLLLFKALLTGRTSP